LPYELVDLDHATKEQRDRHSELHPLRRVPALEHGKVTLFESAALCIYLADLDQEQHRLLPAAGTPERAVVTQWLFFLMAELEAPLDVYALHVADLPEKERIAAIVPWARSRFHGAAEVVEKELGRSSFLAGDRFSVADVVLASMMSWATRRELLGNYPHIRAHMTRMLDRPAARKLFTGAPPS
jgi:glutathione S-transferase